MQSFWHPLAEHRPSPNFWRQRLGHDMSEPSWVVLHTTVCCWPAAVARFMQASEQASSTYIVKLDGSLIQCVDEADAPWTNGTSAGIGSNLDSITIEHEDCGDYNGPRTPELYRTSALLVREICNRHGIPFTRVREIKHNECTGAATACPDSLDVDRIVRMAAGLEPLPGEGGFLSMLTEQQQGDLYNRIAAIYVMLTDGGSVSTPLPAWTRTWAETLGGVQSLQQPQVDVVALAAALAPHLADVVDESQLAADLAPHLGEEVATALAQRLAS